MSDTIEQGSTKARTRTKHPAALVAQLRAHAGEIREQGIVSLAIFGSRARGDERRDSDLDVLVAYDPERPFTLYDLVRVERLLERLTGLNVHVATRDGFRPHPALPSSEGCGQRALMARPLDLVVEELLDYIEQACTYTHDMTFEQYAFDRKTQRAVERCMEVISEASRHIPDAIKGDTPRSRGVTWPPSAMCFATNTTISRPELSGTPCDCIFHRCKPRCVRLRPSCNRTMTSKPSRYDHRFSSRP